MYRALPATWPGTTTGIGTSNVTTGSGIIVAPINGAAAVPARLRRHQPGVRQGGNHLAGGTDPCQLRTGLLHRFHQLPGGVGRQIVGGGQF